jgi:hypothetical protein
MVITHCRIQSLQSGRSINCRSVDNLGWAGFNIPLPMLDVRSVMRHRSRERSMHVYYSIYLQPPIIQRLQHLGLWTAWPEQYSMKCCRSFKLSQMTVSQHCSFQAAILGLLLAKWNLL